MESLKEKYMSLPPPALAVILVVCMAITGFLMHDYYLVARMKNMDAARKQFQSMEGASNIQKQKLRVIEANPLSEDITEIPPEDLQLMADNQNEITYEYNLQDLVGQIKAAAKKTGGSKVESELGPATQMYVRAGRGGGDYRVRKQRLTVRFQSDYNGVSNFLFQLRTMGKMLRLEKVEMNSEKYRGGVNAVVVMNLSLAEGMDPREAEAAGAGL